VIKELETSRDAMLAERNNMQKSVEEYVVTIKNLETQMETMKSESDLAVSSRIASLQKERDDALANYSAIMSEKGTEKYLIRRCSSP
jgi:Ni,Fe-hydrogenase III component G